MKLEIRIEFDTQTGTMSLSHPKEPLHTFGMLEMARQGIHEHFERKTGEPPTSGIEVVRGRLPGHGGKE